ncbi:MAG: type I restriction enzyme HsdR N-terminal domain-containing protein [Rikenellaceae bacterium]
MPQKLNFPLSNFRIKKVDGAEFIWDNIRHKWLLLTPEEWVRQNFIHYIIEHRSVSASHISQEHPVMLGRLSQRADIVVFDTALKPLMLIECKSTEVEITQKVFAQAVRYNSVIKAPMVVVTNGLRHLCCEIDPDSGRYSAMVEIPDMLNFFRV